MKRARRVGSSTSIFLSEGKRRVLIPKSYTALARIIRSYLWELNSGNYVEFLIPVVVTISEILTTTNLIPVKGKPCVLMLPKPFREFLIPVVVTIFETSTFFPRSEQEGSTSAYGGQTALQHNWKAGVPTTQIASARRDLQNVPQDLCLKPPKSPLGTARSAPKR